MWNFVVPNHIKYNFSYHDGCNVINLSDLSFAYNRKTKLYENLNLEIPDGTITCLVGPNGAGKSTLIKIISGVVFPQKGKVEIFGKTYESARDEILSTIYVSIEDPKYYPKLTAKENLKIICLYRGLDDIEARVNNALTLANLDSGKKLFKEFSTGMKQRLSLAAALLFNPKLIILDEPFSGLDPGGVMMLRDKIIELHKQGVSFIISSHLLREVTPFCTHYAFLDKGNILEYGEIAKGEDDYLEKKYVDLVLNAL